LSSEWNRPEVSRLCLCDQTASADMFPTPGPRSSPCNHTLRWRHEVRRTEHSERRPRDQSGRGDSDPTGCPRHAESHRGIHSPACDSNNLSALIYSNIRISFNNTNLPAHRVWCKECHLLSQTLNKTSLLQCSLYQSKIKKGSDIVGYQINCCIFPYSENCL